MKSVRSRDILAGTIYVLVAYILVISLTLLFVPDVPASHTEEQNTAHTHSYIYSDGSDSSLRP